MHSEELAATDERITGQLRAIVAEHGWPTIALVGSEASQAAAMMLVHSPDLAWKEALLPELQRLVEDDKIFGSDIAGLTDRILVTTGKPQKFGTQFTTVDNAMVMAPVEDLEHLDERRARYLLPPMDVYRKLLESMYKMPVK